MICILFPCCVIEGLKGCPKGAEGILVSPVAGSSELLLCKCRSVYNVFIA